MENVSTNLSNLENKADKKDVDKLVPIPVDLSKLSDVVQNDITKKDVYNAKIKNIKDKIPDIINLATNTTLNAKINEVKNKKFNITNLATITSFTADENMIPNVSTLVKKTAYNTKIRQVEKKITIDNFKYMSTQKLNQNILYQNILLQNSNK